MTHMLVDHRLQYVLRLRSRYVSVFEIIVESADKMASEMNISNGKKCRRRNLKPK
jgi:hypothetical protein